ncbi:hypothetical protein BCR37DRAFT_376663 [Protomyces lactucae-debilis]|uniref:SRP9 domain-containing protein n=1 Tax=Protomyces lactucae-debilis TaxID=2754530 RepID=A0A1Y2FQ45_PROLT|nr:uncharacterized protein BCR37DRAFT_376663 [Protomyces lactucae-debilis]ORY86121.1 hypothetical protein BCR37DRAFT_376663 [Protomyces lactucae-debilis]
MPFERDLSTFFDKSAQLLEAFPDAIYTLDYSKHDATRSSITARLHDDAAGICLKFKTDKVLELGRLMVGSTKVSQRLAQLDEEAWDRQQAALMPGTGEAQGESEMKDASTPVASGEAASTASKKKKKKGKK